MNIKILAVLALLGATTVSTGALAATDEIYGRPEAAVAAAIEQKGYEVERVEEWGGDILAFVRDADGGTSLERFDSTTYAHIG